MQMSVKDKQTLRRLAERYSEIAHMDVQKERMDRYYRTNALVVPPVFQVGKRARWLRGIGIEVQHRQIKGDTGAYISSHAYNDQLKNEDDLAKLHPPEVVYDQAATEAALAVAHEVFAGLMDVELVGRGGLYFNIWDDVAQYRGVENLTQWAATVRATINQYYS